MSDVDKALELARSVLATQAEIGVEYPSEMTAGELARALLALHRSHVAQAAVVEAAVEWSASFGELSKRLPPHVHALRNAVDEYERTLRAAKGER